MRTTEQIQAVQKAELESMVSMAEKALNGFEKMALLNMQTLRDATMDAAAAMHTALSARDMQEFMGSQAASPMQTVGQKTLSYAQHVAEIAGSTQAELADAFNQSMARMQQVMREATKNGAGGLPAGSDAMSTLMQSAMNFTAQAFDAAQKAQTEATKMVADDVQSLSQAAAKSGAAKPAQARKQAV